MHGQAIGADSLAIRAPAQGGRSPPERSRSRCGGPTSTAARRLQRRGRDARKEKSVMQLRTATHLGLALTAMVGMSTLFNLGAPPTAASSHREAPLISQDPVADATDLYAFVSPDSPNTVTLISNWIPYENAASGPNWFRFGDDVLYEMHVDNVGDAQDHIVFQFRFKTKVINGDTFLHNTGVVGENMDAEYNLRQYMSIDRLDMPTDGSCKDQALSNCATAKR